MSIGGTSLPYLRVRVVPRFPTRVEGTNGIKVDKTAGVYTIGPSTGDLIEVATVTDDTYVQVWDEQGDTYARIPSTAFVGGGAAVTSVNGQTGAVVLAAADISGFATVATSGDYNDLLNTPPVGTGVVETVVSGAGVDVDDSDAANPVVNLDGASIAALALAATATQPGDLGNSAGLNVGTSAGTVAAGDDSRIVAATPNTRTISAGTGLTGGGTLAANRTIALSSTSIASLTLADTAVQPSGLAAVATSGSFNDLTDKPTIPAGTVTSVGLSLPTGFSVSGSPVTASGTLTGAWASGYQAYTTTEASKLSGIAAGAQVNTVASVAGKTGAVTLVKGDVGLGSVDNTSDLSKPISTATQTALDDKADTASLAVVATTGDYGDLTNLPTLGNVAALDYAASTTTFLRNDGTWAVPPGGGSGGGDMYSSVYDPNAVANDAFDMSNMVEGTTAKILTATERTKLSGIEASADVTDATNVAAAGAFMKSTDDSDDITTGTTNLFMTSAERSKLAGVASGATANTGTVTSVAVAVPSSLTSSGGPLTTSGTITLAHASGYQGYTTAEASKLSGIAAGATANTGTVTSVALAVPTGLSISGSPVTTSGTLTVSYAAGYQGYTSTEATKLSGIATGATANTGTVTSVAASVPTGLSISGSPLTTSGTLTFTWTSGYQGYTSAEASKLAGISAGAQVNAVTSVASKTGAVTLVKADVGLGSVDNTADSAKPVSTAQAAADALKVDKAGDALTGGFTATAVSDGTKTSGTYTPSPSGGNFRKITANGAFSLAAPTATGSYNLTIDITNGASAGAITFSGFVSGYPKGDSYTTTNGHKFKLHISKTDVGITATLEALQ